MRNSRKPRNQLVQELGGLHARAAELEQGQADRRSFEARAQYATEKPNGDGADRVASAGLQEMGAVQFAESQPAYSEKRSPADILCAAPLGLVNTLAPLCRELGHRPICVSDTPSLKHVRGRFALAMVVDSAGLASPFSAPLLTDLVFRRKHEAIAVERGLLLGILSTPTGLQRSYVHHGSSYCRLELDRGRLTCDGAAAVREAIIDTLSLPPYEETSYYDYVTDEMLHSVVESSQAPLIVLDRDWRVWFANLAAQAVFKRPTHLMRGHPVTDLFSSDDSARRFQKLVKEGLRVGGGKAELRMQAWDGREFDASVAYNQVYGVPNDLRAFTLHDITDLKRAEEELQQHRHHLQELVNDRTAELLATNESLQCEITERKRTGEALRRERDFNKRLIQASPAFIVSISPDGKTLMMSEAMLQALGYTAEEVVGKDYLSAFVPEADREMLSDIFRQLVRSNQPTVNENRVVTKDSRELLVEWHGKQVFDANEEVEYFFGVGIDITERKRAEDALRFTQFSIDHTTEAAFWMGPDARFVYVNEAACRSLGYTREELLSMSVHDIDPRFPEEAWPEHWKDLRQHRSLTFESRHRAKAGRVFPVEITANFLEYNGKEYNFAFARDITDRKRAEQAERMAEVGKLASGLVHEVRNPLNAMRMQIAVIRNKCKQPDDENKHAAIAQLECLEHEVLRVQQLASDFLAYGRPASDNPETIELSRVIWDVADFVKPEFNQIGAQVDVTPAADTCGLAAHMDLSKLRRVLLNLAENARQAMAKGGRLSLSCDKPSNHEGRIRVCDTGCGISPDKLPRIFEAFYSTKDDGTGLGLAIVKRTVEAAGGHIRVESEVDCGTCFEIYLPLTSAVFPDSSPSQR